MNEDDEIGTDHDKDDADDDEKILRMIRMTVQMMAIHAFDTKHLGGALSTLLRTVTSFGAGANRLVPTNEGGLNLLLHLYPSREVEGSPP